MRLSLTCGDRGYTLVELMMAVAVTSIVLLALTAGSVSLQRSFAATVDYATAQNDQSRISDYLAVDMRRASEITADGTGGVAIVLPNYYKSDGTPNPPTIVSTMGWPAKKRKKKKNKQRNIIMSQAAAYDPATTVTVTYYKGGSARAGKDETKFYREVNGSAKAIANDVSDFTLSLSEDGDFATTQITFTPRFRLLPATRNLPATTLYQTTLLRNSS